METKKIGKRIKTFFDKHKKKFVIIGTAVGGIIVFEVGRRAGYLDYVSAFVKKYRDGYK
jgi:surfactin synthase thioesterase subunit